MAKITIEELSGSLKEYLNGLGLTEAQVQELIDKFEDEKIGDISQLSTEEKGSLVGAINELFQSANNGKQIIADAIGSPLTEGDTFAAMGNDINQMTIDFRNALAAKGVNAPTDKMESLITRISEIVQSGNIVNNQCMISGEYTLTSDLTAGNSRRITTNLSFNPEYFVVYIPSLSTSQTDSDPVEEHIILTTDDTTYTTYSGNIQHFNSGDRIVAYSDVKITLTYSKSNFNIALDGTYCNFLYIPAGSKIKWYAIGSSQLPNNGGERTITPSTTDQVLPDGYYSGDITVKGDSDLKPENIIEGKEIFGVTGTAAIQPVYTYIFRKDENSLTGPWITTSATTYWDYDWKKNVQYISYTGRYGQNFITLTKANSGTTAHITLQSTNKIDLTPYKRIKIRFDQHGYIGSSGIFNVAIFVDGTSGLQDYTQSVHNVNDGYVNDSLNSWVRDTNTATLDISNVTGDCYLYFKITTDCIGTGISSYTPPYCFFEMNELVLEV